MFKLELRLLLKENISVIDFTNAIFQTFVALISKSHFLSICLAIKRRFSKDCTYLSSVLRISPDLSTSKSTRRVEAK